MHEIAIGLAITFIVAVVIELLFHGMDRDSPMRTAAAWVYGLTSRKEHFFDSYNRRGPEGVKSLLVRWLSDDQVRHGVRRGQFGASIDPEEEERFKGKGDALGTKPRLYLTSWPCFILKRHGLATRQLGMAEDAIERLLLKEPTGRSGVRYVRVSQSVLTDGPVGSQPLLVSYRHTIRAAHVLFSLNTKSPDALAILSAMLDPASDWQCPSGGWRECDRRICCRISV